MAAGLFGLLLCGAGAAFGETPELAPTPLIADPAVRHGVLPNGLRYALMANATPKGGLSLRLAFEVGSLDEDEAERGAAHFVEHLAFRATRNFPEGQLDPAFAPLGVGFGRDQNAFTSHQATVYRLDLPNADAEKQATALRWMRDVASEILFEADAVERERGVVLAERDVRAEPGAVLSRAVEMFKGPGLRTTSRPPIGDLQVLRTISPAALQSFYARWYRPEHAVLVVVGDIPADRMDALEADIARTFGDWRGQGPRPERAPLPGPDLRRGLDALSISEPQVASGLAICRQTAAEPPEIGDAAALRHRMRRLIWVQSLSTRLSGLALSDPAIIEAEALVYLDQREALETCIAVASTGQAWRQALKSVQLEIARFTADGPDEDEVEAALKALRAGALGGVVQAATRDTPALASVLVDGVVQGVTIMEPRQVMRAFNRAVEGVTPADVVAAWRKDWAGAGPFVSIVASQAPTREAVLAAWTENAALAPTPYVKPPIPIWDYGAPGAPGKVVSRRTMTEPDFVRLVFANGVVLNFKQTSFAKGGVELRVDFGHGREELGGRSLSEGFLAADTFVRGGLGRHSYAEIRAMIGDEPLESIDLTLYNNSFALESNSFPDWLHDQLAVIAAYLTDPGFRDELDVKLPSVVANVYAARDASPVAAISQALRAASAPRGVRVMPTRERLSALRSSDFEALLTPIVTTSPLEVTLVGDLDEDTAVELISGTLGALPVRAERPRPPYAGYETLPRVLPAPITVTHAGVSDQAAVALVWPLFVTRPDRRREEYALGVLASVFDDELRHAVRQRLGKVYAPIAILNAADLADEAYLSASVEVAPADLVVVEAEIRAVAARLARGEITPQMLAAAREPLLALAQADLVDNGMWAAFLQSSARYPETSRGLIESPRILEDLDLADVKKAAAAWLSPPPLVLVATPEIRK